MTYETTAAERAPRVSALVHDAESSDVQALLELASLALEHGLATAYPPLPSLSRSASSLAAQIAATKTPSSEPAFAIGTTVKYTAKGEEVSESRPVLGKVTERYLNERGDWEYQVRGRGGVGPYKEEELTAA